MEQDDLKWKFLLVTQYSRNILCIVTSSRVIGFSKRTVAAIATDPRQL